MLDKTINNTLRHLHRECMNNRQPGLEHVVAPMRLRGVESSFKAKHAKMGSEGAEGVAGGGVSVLTDQSFGRHL